MDDDTEVASVMQYPLRLAWAVTVHKSQGMTLDIAEIDLTHSFVKGMGYVALSRLSSIDGLRLMGLNKTALLVEPKISRLDQNLQKLSAEEVLYFQDFVPTDLQRIQNKFIISSGGAPLKEKKAKTGKKQKISSSEITKKYILKKYTPENIAKKRDLSIATIIAHIEKLSKNDKDLDLMYLKSGDDFDCIKQAFKESDGEEMAVVKEVLKDRFTHDQIKLARIFIRQQV
jgi:hypothetical protein